MSATAFRLEPINPASLGAPRGYSNGMLAPAGGRLLTVAGQIAWDSEQNIVTDDFRGQFVQALGNVVEVVRAAGGGPEHLAQLTIFVTDEQEYLGCLRELGEAYRLIMGAHYPAMALVEVTALVEDDAKIEIQGLAVVPPKHPATLRSTEPPPETATVTDFPAAVAPGKQHGPAAVAPGEVAPAEAVPTEGPQ